MDGSAFCVGRRFCDGGRRNAAPLGLGMADDGSKSEIKIMIKITITSRSRSGEVERLSSRGRRNAPPLTPPLQGGERNGRGLSLGRGASIGSLMGDTFTPPYPPLSPVARGGKIGCGLPLVRGAGNGYRWGSKPLAIHRRPGWGASVTLWFGPAVLCLDGFRFLAGWEHVVGCDREMIRVDELEDRVPTPLGSARASRVFAFHGEPSRRRFAL